MFLKRLDTVGFKSFAERVSVEFVPGVTAVVGPNGSGKSNITDAIRWVLGEQSARSLRGSKMEDIIFAGSDTRKALNFAEVSLVLDNEDSALPIDYQEVSITRRVYRSGESEFLINQQSCRLKDIIDLFMDSGLGKEAFSIISQGKVEEILSSKAEERRSIFEEAAGVLKYKQRKRKAEMKLAETQENLYRVEDIIHEIEGQLEPLQRQAETAQEYLKKKDELQQFEVSLLVTEIELLHEQWEKLLKEIEIKKQEALHKQTDINQEEAKIEQEKYAIQRLDESIENLQGTLLTLTQELENLEGRKRLFHERWKHYEENKGKLTQEQQKAYEKITQLTDQLEAEDTKLKAYAAERNKTKESITTLTDKTGSSQVSLEATIEELKSDYIELLNEQAAKRNETQTIDRQLEHNKMKEAKMTERFQDLIQQRETINNDKQEMFKKYEAKQQNRMQKEKEFSSLKAEIQKDNQYIQEQQQKLYQGNQLLQKLQSKKEMLEEMKEDFAGFFHGVKAVLKARDRNQLQGIHGAVAEKIDIPNEFIVAIETALGGQAQHIIVQHEDAAREAINWLKRTNNGRATFLPLTSIQSKDIPSGLISKITNHPGYVGIAEELLTYDSKYEKALKSLLGNIVITKTLKDANDIASQLGRRYRIVTLEGDVVNPGGSMTGGAQKKTNHSLFTREKELEEASVRLVDYEAKTLAFEKEVEKLRESVKAKENLLEDFEVQLAVLRNEEHALSGQYREIELKLSNINDHLSLYDQEQQQFSNEESNLVHAKKDISKRLIQIEETASAVQEKIKKLSDEYTSMQENREKLTGELNKLQVVLAEQESNVKNQREKVNALTEQIFDYEEQKRNVEKELHELEVLKEQGQTSEEIDKETEQKRKHKVETELKVRQKREERQQKIQATNDMERELKEENRILNQMTSDLQEKEVKANRLDVELENRLTLLQEEYTMSFEKAKADFGKTDNIEESKQMVKSIKRAITQLGNVNLGAIDEYERIKERYEFLSSQQDDLNEAKATLYSIIKEMDTEMVKRFEVTFFQIQKEFSVVFTELFGGGRADLKLTNPEDMLETGVDIVAQPPGKKLQNLGLLSGGERALTAIALLFAILRVRPVPFCVLDEVEAALDDANVNRFAQYLKFFSEQTQFIVITHRKGTMEEADVLYGVTMQESGVSKLVSVRLEETEKMIQA
ncbi:chromosome segregation protein [Salirhabdus euzebyi]|uniref:Chromosome partition protein Smc n=1 Tax=Salirhabdus euzebyi TaxID=394506 RepID=A0A841Q3I4_9BACI|nr:chromosome segregation protein SMC [Salirhabdus euzebyi]MBB6452954.1 chromosome segregation protein [Salirhabdus euzebyi]